MAMATASKAASEIQKQLSTLKVITIPLQPAVNGVPVVYSPINEIGYGFTVLQCDDQSTLIRIGSPNQEPIPATSIGVYQQEYQFNQLYIQNFGSLIGVVNPVLILGIIKDPSMQLQVWSPYRDLAVALTLAQLYMLMASGSTTRYEIWNVDASRTTPTVYTDPNQQYYGVPLIQSVTVLSVVSGVNFTISLSALQDPLGTTPTFQDPIPSSSMQTNFILKQMGYSIAYTPVTTGSGTQSFLLAIQQPLTVAQVQAMAGTSL